MMSPSKTSRDPINHENQEKSNNYRSYLTLNWTLDMVYHIDSLQHINLITSRVQCSGSPSQGMQSHTDVIQDLFDFETCNKRIHIIT